MNQAALHTPEATPPHPGPLCGLRVIEMGSLLAGPFAAQLLGDFGAEVIKVEPPNVGDPMRAWGRHKPQGRSLWFPVIARNKKSVTLDLRRQEGQAIARDLIAGADVLVENFKVGALAKYGLGYEQLHARFPKLVYCSITGFGQTGPYAPRPGYDSLVQAMGGIIPITPADAVAPTAAP